jgi:hypothetical protein
MIFGNLCQSETQCFLPQSHRDSEKKSLKISATPCLSGWLIANKNSQSTTALNHCVDCNYLKQSRRLTKYQLEGGGSQILFVAYQIRGAQASLHSHSCESLEYRTLLIEINDAIVMAIDVMSIFSRQDFWG